MSEFRSEIQNLEKSLEEYNAITIKIDKRFANGFVKMNEMTNINFIETKIEEIKQKIRILKRKINIEKLELEETPKFGRRFISDNYKEFCSKTSIDRTNIRYFEIL